MKCFKKVKAYIDGAFVTTDVTFSDRIERVDRAEGDEVPVPDGCIVVPAFIDEHIHGAGGADVMDGSTEALETIADTLAKEGTARFAATTMTAPFDSIKRAVAAVNEYMTKCCSGCAAIGVHLEGPFISKKYKGAQPEEYVLPPSRALLDELIAASGGKIKMITLAPECAGELVNYAVAKGITVSIGHTDADYEACTRAIEQGARCFTHTYNAMRGIHHRDVGTAGAALCFDCACAELICDGFHVSYPAAGLLARSKPEDKLVLITDAMRAKGAVSDGYSELGGQRVLVKDGTARLLSGELAGSVLKMNDAVKNMNRGLGIELETAIACATINPAKNLGISDEYGSIAIGKHADFAVLDGELNVVMTVRDGETVYER